MHTIIKLGLATLTAGAFWASTVQARADEYASELSNPFTKHGLPVPGAYFKKRESQLPATVAVSKSGKGIGEQKQTASKVNGRHGVSPKKSIETSRTGDSDPGYEWFY
jgi:hypothetical protein